MFMFACDVIVVSVCAVLCLRDSVSILLSLHSTPLSLVSFHALVCVCVWFGVWYLTFVCSRSVAIDRIQC